jgi:hypothetical protein
MMSQWDEMAMALDPALVMEGIGLIPDEWQARALRSMAHRLLILASRQSGKSTATSCIALHQALFIPASLVLLVAPAQRQSQELFLKVLDGYRLLGRPVAAKREMATTLELTNDSRIVCLPGSADTIRGFSGPSLIVIDEAALADDELFTAVLPMLGTSAGRLVLLSTPKGQRGFFFEKWHNGGREWERITAKVSECPRIDPAFLEQERRDLGDRAYRQEHECEFLDAIDQVFSMDVINAAFTSTARPLAGV